MKKEVKQLGFNVVEVDHLGHLTPINHEIYKNDAAILAAFEKKQITIRQGFAGFVALPVFTVVDVKEKAAPAPKQTAPKETVPPVVDAK